LKFLLQNIRAFDIKLSIQQRDINTELIYHNTIFPSKARKYTLTLHSALFILHSNYTTPFTIISHLDQDVKYKFIIMPNFCDIYKKYLYTLCILYIANRKKMCYNIVTGKEGISRCTTKYRLTKDSKA
jgi:hypothetical protein